MSKLRNRKNIKKRGTQAIIAFAVVLLITVCGLIINELRKNNAEKELFQNLRGMTIETVSYYGDLILYDYENDIEYKFYGALSTFAFSTEGTVTWTRQYRRAPTGRVYTEPVTSTYKYSVQYMGPFIYNSEADVCVVLENGDILGVWYNHEDPTAEIEHRPRTVNYDSEYDDGLHAPAELMNIDTSYVYLPPSKPSTNSGTKRVSCSWCGGDGRTHDWVDEGNRCSKCDGSGWLEYEE